jgi:hypothetical protein
VVDEEVDLEIAAFDVGVGAEVGDAFLGQDVLAEIGVARAFAAGAGEEAASA